MKTFHPHLKKQLALVAPSFTLALGEARRAYEALGIKPVLVGGMAVGAWTEPRSTKDLDFLAPDEAFEHHGPLVTLKRGLPIHAHGVAIDPVVGERGDQAIFRRALRGAVRSDVEGVWLADPASLAAMKLIAGRAGDLAAVEALIELGVTPDELHAIVRGHPKALHALKRVLAGMGSPSRSAEVRRILRGWRAPK